MRMIHLFGEKGLPQAVGKGLVFLVVGLLLVGWLLSTPGGLLGKADAIGYSVCHRIDGRSFHLGDRQIPLCARCSGMFLGALLGLIYQSVLGVRRAGMPPWKVWVGLGVLVLAFGVDGLNSYLHFFPGAPTLYEPQNWLRLFTGTGMGLVVAAVLFPTFNQTIWATADLRPSLDGWRKVAGLVGLAVLLDLLVLTENPLFLYPLALTSAGSVVVLLVMVYTLIWVMLLRLENHFAALRQLVLPLTGGLAIALLQIAVIDFGRFLLTGTWGGFLIG